MKHSKKVSNLKMPTIMKNSDILGLWHIHEMEMWDKDYFNMEVRAFVRIDKGNTGAFQFGLVSGGIDGRIIKSKEGYRFEFTWDGSDELDPESGSGWFVLKNKDVIEGEFKIHLGDVSKFSARRAKKKR